MEENIEISVDKKLENEIKVEQNEFLNSNIGKIINTGIDIGLKAVLPDIIENQIIEIKNSLISNGLKDGIKEVVNQGIELGKSATGIFTGEFENLSQVENVIKKGGILDSVSKVLDITLNLVTEKGILDKNISKIIKQGKNTILSTVENNIKNSMTEQVKNIEKIEYYCEKWEKAYNEQNLEEMKKNYNSIENYKNKIIPFRNILEASERIKNIQTYIDNNNGKFEISEIEENILNKLL